MRRIKLKPLAPPLGQLRAVLRIDVPMEYKPTSWEGAPLERCRIGKIPENALEDADERLQMLDYGEAALDEMLQVNGTTYEIVLVDENNEIWSEVVGEPDEDESRPTLFD